MARFFLCLCLLLTLWLNGSRSSVVIGSGSLAPGLQWGTSESQQLGKQAARLWAAGDAAGAEALHERQLALARNRRDSIAIIRSLQGIGAMRIAERRYQSALAPLSEARRLAKSIDDRLDLGAVDLNLSSLYLQMWNVDSAVPAAEEGLAASAGLAKSYYRHSMLLHLGRLYHFVGDGRAEGLLKKGIEAAREQGDAAQEAVGWDYLGEEWFQREQLADAERAFTESFRIRTFRAKPYVSSSYSLLGKVKLAEGDLTSAARLTELAIMSSARVQSGFPEYLLLHQRGSIRLARGDVRGAIADFRAAVDQAIEWRREILPASSVLTTSNSELEKRIFDSFVETAAHEAVRTGDPSLARESFQAMEWNRALSLRETTGLSGVWRKKLPAAYWETIGEMRQVPSTTRRRDLNLKLTEMEAQAGLGSLTNRNENFRTQTSLTSLQQGLSNSDLLLSFHLGSEGSYVWALTRQSLNLYPLAPAAQIRKKIEEFRRNVRNGRDADPSGSDLYDELFGQLTPREAGKANWLLSLDDALFEAPIAALKEADKYLVEMHSLKIVPGALWIGRDRPMPAGWFLGVGDPVYNTADPRWRDSSPAFAPFFAQAATTDGLNRLVASAEEVESSERSWAGSTLEPGVILTGTEARRDKFITLARRRPELIHLATHVLTSAATASIAFSLESSGHAGYLNTAEVAMLDVPGAVVTMTGCETGGGERLAGAGLIGLTRAWQVAGAAAVVSTLWPVRDSSGELFMEFYRRLRTLPAAEALRQSQIQMIRSGTWRAQARHWAAYQVTGGQLAK